MRVLVELVGRLARSVNAFEFWIFLDDQATVRDLLKKLEEDKKVKIDMQYPSTLLLLNGRAIEDLDVELKNLDKIVIAPVAFGG